MKEGLRARIGMIPCQINEYEDEMSACCNV